MHVGLSHDCNGIYIPNVFPPNGDNVNDEWVVYINDPNVIGVHVEFLIDGEIYFMKQRQSLLNGMDG